MSHSGRRSMNESSCLSKQSTADWLKYLAEAGNEELIESQQSVLSHLTKQRLRGIQDEHLNSFIECLEDLSTTLWNRGIRTEGIKEWLI